MAIAQTTPLEQTIDDEARAIGKISYDTTGQLLSKGKDQQAFALMNN